MMTYVSTLTALATFALASAASAQTNGHHAQAPVHATAQQSERSDGDLQTGRSIATEQASPSTSHATYDFGLKND